jgi:hypothetical protein
MRRHTLTAYQRKILKGMDDVHGQLVACKKRINSELAIMRDNKTVYIKPS